MAERSKFWTTNGTGDGPSAGYTAAEWVDLIRKLFTPGQDTTGGVIYNEGNMLAVSGTASPLSLASGTCIDYGFIYENTTPLSLTVVGGAPSSGTAAGHVILRANWAAQTVRAFAERSGSGVMTPPALVQTAGTTWEIRLATFTMTTAGVIAITQDNRAIARYGTDAAHVIGRQGYVAGSWSENLGGSLTNYAPGLVGSQRGMVRWAGAAASSGSTLVTFPKSFTGSPVMQITPIRTTPNVACSYVPSPTGDSATLYWRTIDGSTLTSLDLAWYADGPMT